MDRVARSWAPTPQSIILIDPLCLRKRTIKHKGIQRKRTMATQAQTVT